MGSSSLNSKQKGAYCLCLLRNVPVKSSKEERVRQALVNYLTSCLGYPTSSMAIEKKLSELPGIQAKGALPNRRCDLLIYSNSGKPLLLVECKAGLLGQKAVVQLLGYNKLIGAPFVALVSDKEVICTTDGRQYLDAIPAYEELLRNN